MLESVRKEVITLKSDHGTQYQLSNLGNLLGIQIGQSNSIDTKIDLKPQECP